MLAACAPSDSDDTTGSTGSTAASMGTGNGSGDTATSGASTGSMTGAATDTGGAAGGYCIPNCQTAADCATGQPGTFLDEDNYACENGLCRYLGCLDSSECPQIGGGFTYTCAAPAPGKTPACVLGCTAPTDCVLDPMDSPDKFDCVNGGCFTKPCTEADVCAADMVCAPHAVVGDDSTDPVCTQPCATVDDCDLAANGAQPAACDNGACVFRTCSSDADCPDPEGTTCAQP